MRVPPVDLTKVGESEENCATSSYEKTWEQHRIQRARSFQLVVQCCKAKEVERPFTVGVDPKTTGITVLLF